ncbi:general transcription factor II-I repeat domain-containing protein 2A [Trichonephila clavipes]|nr:general transcription factor II-I repeat domain-containing protein 2A [Trichonephila clavipes]
MGGTLNSRRDASPLVRLVEGEEKWEVPDHPMVFSLQIGGRDGEPLARVPIMARDTIFWARQQSQNASSAKEQKVQDSKCNREFQIWWTEKHGIISKGDKAMRVLCSGTIVGRISSVKRHSETNPLFKKVNDSKNN